MSKVDARLDIVDAIAGLDALGIETKGMMRKMLRALATVTKKRVKKGMGSYLQLGHLVNSTDFSLYKGKGSLKDSVYGFARSGSHAVVASGQMFKAEALEHGATLVPRKRAFLSFQTEDGWVRAKSLTIPPKRWFSRSVEGFEDDPEYSGTIQNCVDKAIRNAGMGT